MTFLMPQISLVKTNALIISDVVQNHGNHQAVLASDPALEGPLDTLAGQCKWPWAQGVVPGPPPSAQAPGAAQVPPAAVVVPVPGAGAGAAPAVPARAPARARARVPARAPAPPAEVEALALDLNLEWLQESDEDEEKEGEEKPVPGHYYESGVPYGTGPAIPSGR